MCVYISSIAHILCTNEKNPKGIYTQLKANKHTTSWFKH